MLLESNLFDNGCFCPLYSQTGWLAVKSRIIKQLNIKFPNVRSGPVQQCRVHGVLIAVDNEPFLQRNRDANYASAREA